MIRTAAHALRTPKLSPPVVQERNAVETARSTPAPQLHHRDTFEGVARASAISSARSPDGLKTYGELSAAQRHLLGANGASTYSRLSTDQRGVFLLLTQRMERNGVDFGGLRLKDPENTIRRNRLLFENDPAGMARLEASLKQGVRKGTYVEDPVFAPFHKGMSDWGVRENRGKWSTQIGMGPEGAFVDVDRYNHKKGVFHKLGHLGEIAVPGKPSPLQIAQELGENLGTRSPSRHVA